MPSPVVRKQHLKKFILASQLRNKYSNNPATAEENSAIIILKKDSNITVSPDYKGGAILLIDKMDYKAKIVRELSNSITYL